MKHQGKAAGSTSRPKRARGHKQKGAGTVMVSRGEEHDRLVGEIRVLDRRMSVVNGAIFLCVASGCAICLVVILLFASELVDAHLGTAIAILFILAMLLQAAAFGTFIQEIRLAARTIHIRNEVLYHKAEAEEENAA